MSILSSTVRLFVAPAEPGEFAPPRPRPEVVGVLAGEADLLVAAGAAAACLRREARTATALVGAWRGHDQPPLPALAPGSPGARRLASKLVRRGLVARACGVLCAVELPGDPEAATAAFRDAAAAAEAPAVLALARREPAMDPLFAAADRLWLGLAGGTDPELAELALAGLAGLGPGAERMPLPAGIVARQAARLGLAAFPAREPAPHEPSIAGLQERLS